MNSFSSKLQIERILVPVDFSDCSRRAVEFATNMARRFRAEVFLIHVVDPYLGTGDLLLDMARLQTNFEKNVRTQLEQWSEEFDPRPQTIVRLGAPAQEILEAAKTLDVGAIVISSHGRGAIARFFLGSVAERVVRHATCPVIVLPWHKRLSTNSNPNPFAARSDREPELGRNVTLGSG